MNIKPWFIPARSVRSGRLAQIQEFKASIIASQQEDIETCAMAIAEKAAELAEIAEIPTILSPTRTMLHPANEAFMLQRGWTRWELFHWRWNRIGCMGAYTGWLRREIRKCRRIRSKEGLRVDIVHLERLRQCALTIKLKFGLALYLVRVPGGARMVEEALDKLAAMANVSVGPRLAAIRP